MNKKWMVLCVLASSTPAWAADETGHWYINPQVGNVWVDNDRVVDDDLYYGLGIGKHLNENWSLELNGLMSGHDDDGAGADLDLTALSLDFQRVFYRDARIAPYFSAGVGWLENDRGDSTAEDVLGQAGLGLLIHAWSNSTGSSTFTLRPEVKVRWDEAGASETLVDYLAGVGFQFSFGQPRPVPLAAPASEPPPPVPVVPPPPADSDGDGVLDPSDQCPGTPRGTAVDSVGCARKDAVTLEGVTFENDSATLTGSSSEVLAKVATYMKAYPRLKVELQGHTDSVGAAAYNLDLSQRRAESVREYLIGQGVGASQLTARGFGETQPVADNNTAEGRVQNRRVVMQVTDNPGDVQVQGEGEAGVTTR